MQFFRIQNNQRFDEARKMGAADDNFQSIINVENLCQGFRGLKEHLSLITTPYLQNTSPESKIFSKRLLELLRYMAEICKIEIHPATLVM